jgi:hypothetical protein
MTSAYTEDCGVIYRFVGTSQLEEMIGRAVLHSVNEGTAQPRG